MHLSVTVITLLLYNIFGFTENQNKGESKGGIYPPEKFTILKSELHGKPIIGSINQAYSNYPRKSEYPWCLILSIALATDSLYTTGLPIYRESQIANNEEDRLVDAIKKITTAHYIGHLFNDGFLDIYIYLNDPKAVNSFLQNEKDKPELKRGIGFKINRDTDWQTVKPFMQ